MLEYDLRSNESPSFQGEANRKDSFEFSFQKSVPYDICLQLKEEMQVVVGFGGLLDADIYPFDRQGYNDLVVTRMVEHCTMYLKGSGFKSRWILNTNFTNRPLEITADC